MSFESLYAFKSKMYTKMTRTIEIDRNVKQLQGVEVFVVLNYPRSTIFFLISPIALAGFSPFGHVWVQFIMVWQR